MTEEEWNTTTDPTVIDISPDTTQRKRRLFQVACCRRILDLIPEGTGRTALEVAEAYADNLVSDRTRQNAQRELKKQADEADEESEDALLAVEQTLTKTISHRASYLAEAAVAQGSVARLRQTEEDPYAAAYESELASQVPLLRCIFGNPFRPVTLNPRWQTETVVALANGIYSDRAFDRIPILADALEEAGCDNAEVLNHCRGDGLHVRGCWVVDLVLGKE